MFQLMQVNTLGGTRRNKQKYCNFITGIEYDTFMIKTKTGFEPELRRKTRYFCRNENRSWPGKKYLFISVRYVFKRTRAEC